MNPNCPIPNNINPLSPTGFKLSISKIPEITYFCQEANLPDLSLTPLEVATPFSMSAVPGDILHFGELDVSFIIDEQMKNYKAIWDWMVGLGFPENYTQYQNLSSSNNVAIPAFGNLQGNYSDGVLEILGGNNIAVQTIRFADLHPVAIGTLNFQSNVTDINYLVGQATFRYTYYNFVNNTATTLAAGSAGAD
jgi:hypothetical protein